MSQKVTKVMIGGYLIKESAMLDYEAVIKSGAEIDGVVLATRDLEGKVSVEMTDHIKRTGAVGLGAAGFVVGLFAPPLLLATAVGAAFGAGCGPPRREQDEEPDRKTGGGNDPVGWGGADRRLPGRVGGGGGQSCHPRAEESGRRGGRFQDEGAQGSPGRRPAEGVRPACPAGRVSIREDCLGGVSAPKPFARLRPYRESPDGTS